MSYVHRQRALSGVSTVIPRYRRPRMSLGSLGDDTSGDGTTLSQPTLPDPATLQWQADVKARLDAGVATLQKAELQKWLQIGATVMIPVFTMIWKGLVKRGTE